MCVIPFLQEEYTSFNVIDVTKIFFIKLTIGIPWCISSSYSVLAKFRYMVDLYMFNLPKLINKFLISIRVNIYHEKL